MRTGTGTRCGTGTGCGTVWLVLVSGIGAFSATGAEAVNGLSATGLGAENGFGLSGSGGTAAGDSDDADSDCAAFFCAVLGNDKSFTLRATATTACPDPSSLSIFVSGVIVPCRASCSSSLLLTGPTFSPLSL